MERNNRRNKKKGKKGSSSSSSSSVITTALFPSCGIRNRFVIKLQIYPTLTSKYGKHKEYFACYGDKKIDSDHVLCYDKSREYKVLIFKKKQEKEYNKLFRFIYKNGMDTNNAKKGYFYSYVDKHKKLHIFLDQMQF